MTKKERIAQLERELAEVKRRLDTLEQWRIVFPSEPQVVPCEPPKWPYRDTMGEPWWMRQPQTGDPLPEPNTTISCGATP